MRDGKDRGHWAYAVFPIAGIIALPFLFVALGHFIDANTDFPRQTPELMSYEAPAPPESRGEDKYFVSGNLEANKPPMLR